MENSKRIDVKEQLRQLKEAGFSAGYSESKKKINVKDQLKQFAEAGFSIPEKNNFRAPKPKKWIETEVPKQAASQTKRELVEQSLRGTSRQLADANNAMDYAFKVYGGVKNADGSIAFPTDEGVNAYKKALQNRDNIANQAYVDTANRAYAKTMQQAEQARARQPEKDRPAFEMRYSKSAAGQTYALAQAIEEYNSAYAERVAFETKNNYTGKEYRWNTGKAEEQHEALIAKEKEAYSKMRQARANLYNTDVDESDAYYQLVDNEYKRAAEMHGLDGYLEANNLKTIYRGDDSKIEAQMREEINGGVYKKHSAAVSRFQDWIGKYDENIKRLQSDGSVDSAKLWQDQSQKLFYDLEDKRELIKDGKLPEAGSKSDWAFFIAAAKTQDDFSDYAKVDPQIATPKMKEGYKKTPSGNNVTDYPTNKKQQAKNKAEALFFEVNGADHQSTVFSGLPSYMSDDEVEVFNYFYQNKKFGPEAALTYYNEILPDLKQRRSNEFDYKEASRRAKEAQFGGYASSLLYSGLTGFANAVLGIVQWIPGTEDWNKTNTMAAHELQRNQSYWQRIGSGAAQSIGGMLPSIMAGNYLGTAASLGTTFLSSGGSAAAEGRKMGMGGVQAAAYGAQVGAAEAGLQYALSGIPGLKKIGNVWDKIAASATTNAGKIATRFVGGIAGEVLEENLQNYIEPAAKCFVGFEAWEDYDAPTVQDFIDTTLSTILASGIMSGVNLKNDADLTKYETGTVEPWIADALKIAKPDTNIYKIAKELKTKMNNGERITPDVFEQVKISALFADAAQETARLMTEQELAERRAAQVQEANPDASVVTSSAAQSYLDSGVSLEMANNAAEVLDKVTAGEITSENLSSANIDKLQLHVPAMAAVAAKTMGVELPKITTKAEARNAFRNAIRQYEANKTAQDSTGQSEIEAGQMIAEQTDTFEDKTVRSAQPQILPTEDATENVVQPVRESQPVRVPQVRAEGTMSFTNFYNELSAVNGSKINGDTAMTDYFDLYKQRVATDPSFMSPAAFAQNYRAEHPQARSKEVMQAYRDYLAPSRSVERQDYSEFAEEYKKTHPDANINELAIAYQNYLSDDVKHDAKQTEQYGVIEDEYSAQVEPQFVEAVDALAKLFKTNIRFAELGEDNGKYDPEANEILLDIHPNEMFVQVAGHEITHQLKKKISEAAWENFEKYAVKAMGGDAAVREKQAFNKKYAKVEDAREEVACDFVGKLLSDKQTLNDFCYAVEHKQVRSEAGKWLINTCKWVVGKFTNRPKKAEAALIDTVKSVFGTDIETATEAIKALQTAYQEATKSDVLKKNTTAEGGVKHSIKRTKNMSWEEQINGALYDERNIRRNDTLIVAKAKDTYIENVVEELPFAIPQSVMTKAMTGKDISHSIKRGKLSKLEDGIINATMVIVNPDRNAIVFVTNIKQGGLPIVVSFERNTEFDGDRVHKATSIHLQVDLHSMLKSLSKNADIFVKKNEPDPVGATDNLRGLAAKIKLVDIISNEITSVNPTEQETSKKDFKAVDAQYLTAVERGDMEEAQRMVDETANEELSTSADDPDIRYDKKWSQESGSGDFDTSGTHWALKEELIDKKDLAIFYHAIANLSKRGYSYHRTFRGEYIIESGNKMIFTNGDYNRPTISRVITFNDRYENNMAEYKEWIYDAVDQRDPTRLGETLSLIDIYEGEGYVSDRSPESFSKHDRKERAGEGSNRRTDFAGTESEEVKADKKSRLTEGDVFSTEDGKQTYAERYGMQLETEGQAHRAAARDARRADEAKQKAQSAEVAKEAEALLEEKMQKAAEDKLEERRKKYFTPPRKQKAPDLSEMSREELQAGLLKAERNLRLERLKKENAQSQLKRTNGSKTDPTGVHNFARSLVKSYDQGQVSNERVQAITKSMVEVFDRAATIYDKLNDAEASAMIVLDYAQKLADEIVKDAKVYEFDPSMTEYAQYDELRKVLKNTTFLLPKQFAEDVSPEFGKWKNRYFGKFNVKLVDGGKGDVDSIYQDLAENYPEFFRDSSASEPDLLLQIAEVADRINAKETPSVPLWKTATEADIEIITADIETKVLTEFMRVAEKPRLKTKMDTVVERFEKKLSDLRSEMKSKSAKAVSDAVKKETIKNERETLRIVKYYEKQLERIEKDYDQKIEQIEKQARRKAKKADLEKTFAKDDAKKRYEELDRKSKRKIERLRNEKQAQIDRLKRIARQNAIARTRKGAEGLRAIQKAWQDKGENFRVLDSEKITTKTKSPDEIKTEKSRAARLKNFYTEARRAFITDIVDIEDFAREQNRPDNANVMATMYKNSSATVAAIHENALYAPSGDVVDSRSLAEVALCWKNDNANGEIDEASQRVFEEYLYHRHGADRMSIENKARLALDDFIYEHPEFDPSSIPHYSQKEILARASDGDENAVKYIELAKSFAEAKNKPVMGAEGGVAVNATTHEMIYKDIESKAPWVKQKAEELYGWWDKFMNAWVVGTELSEDQYKRMKEMYPHYVPTYRAFEKTDKGVFVTNKDGTTVKRSIRAAKGSTMDLMQVENSLAVQVAKIVESRRFNDLALNIVHEALFAYDPNDASTESGKISDYVLFADDYSSGKDILGETDDYTMRTENADKRRLTEDNDTMVLTAWENGVPVRAYVSKGLKKSLDALTGAYDPFAGAVKLGNMLTGLQKAAITGYNPFFAGRNVPRDFALANVNSVAGLAFAKYETIAIAKMAKGDEDWQRFKALGGTESTQYEAEKGFAKNISKQKSLGAKAGNALGAFNNATESMTRFAEYLATIDRVGDTPEGRMRAIKNAAEVTVDFSRHGTVGKVLNAWIPYWNPQIQGMSRLLRSVLESKDVKTALKTLGKATAVSVLPEALFQALLYALGGYDDWEELDDRTKDAYYAVPIGDGKFIKIAKGREWAQIIGNPLMRLWQGLNGREDPFENYWETSIAANFMLPSEISLKGVLDTVGVTDAVILSQVIDLETNKDFAGRTIVPYEYQEGSAKEQYDENTSWLAKIIGKSFGLSPMKIDYIIGDYFGDFGDMLIEATNESDTTFGNKFLDTLLNSFVVDNAYSSETNNDYYEMIDELTVAVSDKELRDPDYKNSVEYKTQQAINSYYQSNLKDLRAQSKNASNDSQKRAITLEMRGWQADALDFYDKCMSGEIKEPELYVKYLQYGSTTRDELIRLDKFNGEDYDYSFVPSIDVPKIGDHKNTDEEKNSYRTMYTNQYTTLAENIIASSEYQKASDEEKCSMLEGVEELAYFYAKREYATKFGLTSKNYDPETEENKLDNLMEAGATFAEAYNVVNGIVNLEPTDGNENVTDLQKWSQAVSDKSLDDSVIDVALRNEMSKEQEEKYNVCFNAGVSPREYVKVYETIAKTKPVGDNKNVNTLQKLEICCKTVSGTKSQDAMFRNFLSGSALDTYAVCYDAGVTPKQYIDVEKKIDALKPIGTNDSIKLGQKLEVCVNAVYSSKARDALVRKILNAEQEEEYDRCIRAGITTKQYAEYQMAAITYAGGRWSENELNEWMRRQGFTAEQKRVLRNITDKSW